MKNSLFTALAVCFSLSLFAQDLTIWRLYGDHSDTHGHDNESSAVLVDCGGGYNLAGQDGETVVGLWSLKNEGDQTLNLDLPLSFTDGSSSTLTISSQPASASLAPGEETHFEISYATTNETNYGFLNITSNDADSPNCGFWIEAGRFVEVCLSVVIENPTFTESTAKGAASNAKELDCSAPCVRCACVNGMIEQQCDERGIMWILGLDGEPIPSSTIFLGDLGQSCADLGLIIGEQCNPISISDPCLCENVVTNDLGDEVFRDTLEVETQATTPFFMTNNGDSGSFTTLAGADVTDIVLMDADPMKSGIQHVFYRYPGTTTSVSINGVPFTAPEACLELTECEDIPTMGEWALMVLMLLLSSIGLVYLLRSRRTLA